MKILELLSAVLPPLLIAVAAAVATACCIDSLVAREIKAVGRVVVVVSTWVGWDKREEVVGEEGSTVFETLSRDSLSEEEEEDDDDEEEEEEETGIILSLCFFFFLRFFFLLLLLLLDGRDPVPGGAPLPLPV